MKIFPSFFYFVVGFCAANNNCKNNPSVRQGWDQTNCFSEGDTVLRSPQSDWALLATSFLRKVAQILGDF